MNTFPRTGYHGSSGYMYAKHFDRFLSCFPGTHFIQPIEEETTGSKLSLFGEQEQYSGADTCLPLM